MRNYLALIGWSFDDHTTVMTTAELIERFTLERVNSSPGVFDFAEAGVAERRALAGAAGRTGSAAELLRVSGALGFAAGRRSPTGWREAAPIVQEKLRELCQFERLRRVPVRAAA